jgi:hypothetical protein
MRLRQPPRRFTCAPALLLIAALAAQASAQSGDANFPTPVFSNVVAGRIAPRDVGDPRRTRHFYIFRSTEGDLSVRLESANLIGDLDVFTARTLRPILKITLLGGSATDAAKSVYLRAEETLVLRVEARAVGDQEGSYRVTLGGSFAPAPAGLAEAPEPTLPAAPGERGDRGTTRRVTSTGARIDEPAPAVPVEEARGEAKSEPTPAPEESNVGEERPPAGEGAARSTTPRRNTRRGRAGSGRARGRAETPAQPPRSDSEDEANRTASAAPEAEAREETRKVGEAEESPRPAPRARGRGARNTRRGAGRDATARENTGATPAPTAPAPTPQRLVIVTKGGETIERDMSTVRRVTVENNRVVVTTTDGKTSRLPLAEVEKMTIEPAPQP